MQSTSLISIIIPTYNRAHLIEETLDSLLLQTHKNWECIIVDDGSVDNTKEIISHYISQDARFKFYERPERFKKGANGCRNYGYELSNGDFIKWFDSDDLMCGNLLEEQLLAINNADVCVCKLEYFDFLNNQVLKETTIFSSNLIEDYLVGNVTFYISGPLWDKKFLLKQKTIFDEDISNLDDWDFNLRMLYSKPRIKIIDKVLIKYRVHSESLSSEIKKCNFPEILSEFKARRKHLLLLFFKRNIDTKVFRLFIIKRNKYYLRESLIKKEQSSFSFFMNLLFTQLLLIDLVGLSKTVVAFLGLKFFNKGYKLLK